MGDHSARTMSLYVTLCGQAKEKETKEIRTAREIQKLSGGSHTFITTPIQGMFHNSQAFSPHYCPKSLCISCKCYYAPSLLSRKHQKQQPDSRGELSAETGRGRVSPLDSSPSPVLP